MQHASPSSDRLTYANVGATNGATAIITLNDPANRNALSSAMMTEISERLTEIAATPEIRAVVIQATGNGFCAGHDLKEIQAHRNDGDGGRAFFTALFEQCTALMAQIRTLPQPVIASVQGTAVAAGCQLVATADLAIASDNARFGVNGINAGFFCSTPGVALTRNIGRKAAMELLLTGRLMEAAEAQDAGLLNRVVAADQLESQTLALAHSITDKSGPVISFGKDLFHTQIESNLDDAYNVATPAMVENLIMEDCDEGIRAFIEKREPQWAADKAKKD